MKHNLYSFIIILIIANSCTAMEIPLSSQEKYALFLDNNSIFIHGKGSCRITDIYTQQDSTTLNNLLTPGTLYMHPHKKYFALSQRGKIKVYETKDGKECAEFNRHYFDRPYVYFNPSSEKDFFAWQERGFTIALRQYDYTTQETRETGITNILYTGDPIMDIHPTQQEICIQDTTLDFHEYNEKDKRFIKLFQKIQKTKPLISLIKYSPDGSLTACMDSKSIDIINDNQSSSFYDLTKANSSIFSLEFHPNNNVLALLYVEPKENVNKLHLTHEDFNLILQYHDIEQKNIIAATSLSELYPSCMLETKRALSFSPDGKRLGIILKDKYVILPVPFEVIYKPEAKERVSHLLFVLKNNEMQLPSDLINLIVQTSLETYNRYHLNALPLKNKKTS
ncbi:MAG TPA: hypothetical protein VKU36_00215 [Candidatus Babeliales bacterium]|nr:hypothetical protein [Candidatus Babeliales bacterium]